MSKHEEPARRAFLRGAMSGIGVAVGAVAVGSLAVSCEKDETQPQPVGPTVPVEYDVSKSPELSQDGGVATVLLSELDSLFPVFIARVNEASFNVFSSKCTHEGCQVGAPFAAGENCQCPCHLAEYSPVNGAVVGQPITGSATDLKRYATAFNGGTNILTITKA